jgi:hypothetical protein
MGVKDWKGGNLKKLICDIRYHSDPTLQLLKSAAPASFRLALDIPIVLLKKLYDICTLLSTRSRSR